MSHPARRSRNQRVDKSYRLTLATGGFSIGAVAAFALALFTGFSWGWFVLLAALSAVAALMLRSSLR